MANSGLKAPQLGIYFSISSGGFASTIPVPKSDPKWHLFSHFFVFHLFLFLNSFFVLNLIQQTMEIDDGTTIPKETVL